METALLDWLNLGARLLHVVAAIAWIGASFYFVWLDNSLQPPPDDKRERGVAGDLWAIHGGGIYEVAKYRLAPPRMPQTLHWFKWEAYTTWLSGGLLMFLLYYLQARLYLLGGPWIDAPGQAIAASVALLVGTLALYEIALRTPLRGRPALFAVFVLLLSTLLAWLAVHLFAARAAWLHVGAALATIMAANVFLGIIPSQKRFVAAVAEGREPDGDLAALAKLRSTHNNYLTLPVLFCMISNHYPALYGHPYGWQLLIAISAVLAWTRHFFNLRNQGIVRPSIPISAAVAMVLIFVAAAFATGQSSAPARAAATDAVLDDGAAMALVARHCTVCHAAAPTQPGFVAPPGGHLFETLEQVRTRATLMSTSVASGYMPLGNLTGLEPAERTALTTWLGSLSAP
ncbi:MAG TPA: urate hydroxylase PuuD [Pseudomonadales bacterium]|nr:urate hydroxylase PuuD [Pseudomonadales bacterium]